MLSHGFADQIRKRIFDNTTFPPDYYMNRYCPFISSRYCLIILLKSLFQVLFIYFFTTNGRWSQLRDHGTSHFCIVDKDRNAVSMTTTVNYAFGAGVLSPSTGIVLNNEMDDFSIPAETTPDSLPPAPANFIRPNKRPLSSMTPIIVTKVYEHSHWTLDLLGRVFTFAFS